MVDKPIRPKLTFDQANTLCQVFVPMGDMIFDVLCHLQATGFTAWEPYQAFIESCGTPADIEVHRQFMVAQAKVRLGVPWPMRMNTMERSQLYSSPFLRQLREERDSLNGVPDSELTARYGGGEATWRREIDPCQRKKVFAEVNDKAIYEARWQAMLDEQRLRLEEELTVHATDLCRAHTFDKDGRYALFAAVMARDAAPLGFHSDKARSRRNYPVFSKAIGAMWDLCWSIEDGQDFFWNPFEGLFVPRLTIRSHKLRGSLSKAEQGEFLEIRYQHIVPGFGNAYWKFFGLDELETMIRAHLCFYSLMSPIIEPGLQRVLGDATT